MEKTLQKIESITKSNFPNKIAYVIWNINKENWVAVSGGRTIFCNAVWNDKNIAEEDISGLNIEKYEIVELEMSVIHQDLIRIMNLKDKVWDISEKKHLIYTKLEQIFKVYIFRNEELKKKMKEKYKC